VESTGTERQTTADRLQPRLSIEGAPLPPTPKELRPSSLAAKEAKEKSRSPKGSFDGSPKGPPPPTSLNASRDATRASPSLPASLSAAESKAPTKAVSVTSSRDSSSRRPTKLAHQRPATPPDTLEPSSPLVGLSRAVLAGRDEEFTRQRGGQPVNDDTFSGFGVAMTDARARRQRNLIYMDSFDAIHPGGEMM